VVTEVDKQKLYYTRAWHFMYGVDVYLVYYILLNKLFFDSTWQSRQFNLKIPTPKFWGCIIIIIKFFFIPYLFLTKRNIMCTYYIYILHLTYSKYFRVRVITDHIIIISLTYVCIIITVLRSSNKRPKNHYHEEYVYDGNVWGKFEK